jgi:hypothetical protein
MEFTPRGNRAAAPQPVNSVDHPQHHAAPARRKHIDWAARTIRFELFTVIVGTALLLAAISLYVAFSGNGVRSESDRVDKPKYQAIFLNGGVTSGSVSYSTYFGHISRLNDKYIVLNDVYYLTDQSSSKDSQSSSSPQLTKLGCQQLHSPYDEMVINRSQLAFWENIKDDGKVVTAIKAYQKQNPKGPDCSQQSQSSGANNQSPTTPQTTTPTTTPTSAPTPTTTPPTNNSGR